MRTTVDIDDPILKEVKALQARQGKSLGRLISDLLAQALHQQARKAASQERKQPTWIRQAMRARIDLADKEALYAAMEGPSHEEQDKAP
jgi:hypothetical protein